MLYSLQDITLIPLSVSSINSRSECIPHYNNGKLPIFVAPMSQILDENNWKTFNQYVNTIIPRNIDIQKRLELCIHTFCAFSLDEFEEWFINSIPENSDELFKDTHYVLIDVANGHMERVLDLCKKAKQIWWKDSLIIMAGNVANPTTYYEYVKAGIDYIRISIGSGSQCTTANTGIFYPMASLLLHTKQCKAHVIDAIEHNTEYKSVPKIVADGGFNTFGDIIKALALGADYVMCGKIFAQTVEACGQIYRKYINEVDLTEEQKPFVKYELGESYIDVRNYYGMSTKIAQKEFGKEGNKTEEGIYSTLLITGHLDQWITEFTDYLKSAMSYTNHKCLNTFIGGVETEILSPTAIRTFK